MAEHALGMMLSLSKRTGETDQFMRAQDGIARNSYMGRNIQGKTLGLIDRRMAELCGSLFGMRILAYDPYS